MSTGSSADAEWVRKSSPDIRHNVIKKSIKKNIFKVNVRYINSQEPGVSITNSSIGKATNLVDIEIHGKKFEDVVELRTFLEPLFRVKRLVVDWPPVNRDDEDDNAPFAKIGVSESVSSINRLTYLSATIWDVPFLKIFLRSLNVCHKLKELRVVVVTDRGSDSYDDTSNLIPEELINLEVVQVSGFRSMQFKRHFVTTLPNTEQWTEFQLSRCFNIQNFHLEKKNLEICQYLQGKKFLERISRVHRWDEGTKSGMVLLTECLLKAAIGIVHENSPKEFCCLSVPKNGSYGCALKIDEAKLLLKNLRHQISFLYLNHDVEPECDVHLIAAAFPNLTEIVLSNIITGEAPSRKEFRVAEGPSDKKSSNSGSQNEETNSSTSFELFIKKTSNLRNLTLDAYTNKLGDDKTWDLAALNLIPKWKNLRSLRLLSVPIKNGMFLIEIGKQCAQLETMALYNLGSSEKCCYMDELPRFLGTCRKLKDFAIEASNMGQLSVIFTSLNKNCQLEIVRVVNRGEMFTTVNLIPSIKQLLRRCRQLSTLICIIDKMSKADSDELSSTLQRLKDELNRPTFKFQLSWPRC